MPAVKATPYVQVLGKNKTAIATAHCKRGSGLVIVNGRPLAVMEPAVLRQKIEEPILLLGKERFKDVDIKIRVKGGGHVSQVNAARQALAKGMIAYHQRFVDEASKKEIKDIITRYDRSLLVAPPRTRKWRKATK